MNKLLSFFLISFFVSNILCEVKGYGETCTGSGDTCKTGVQKCDNAEGGTNKCVCATDYFENKDKTDCVAKGAYSGPCKDGNTCTTQTTQQCSSGFCVCAKGYKENTGKTDCEVIAAGTYGGKCNSGACSDTTTQECSSDYCVCKSGYFEKNDKSGCELPAAYGADCSSKSCDTTTQSCDATTKKCVCASGYKENSAKNGCEKEASTTDGNSSSFLKTSLLILFGITAF